MFDQRNCVLIYIIVVPSLSHLGPGTDAGEDLGASPPSLDTISFFELVLHTFYDIVFSLFLY